MQLCRQILPFIYRQVNKPFVSRLFLPVKRKTVSVRFPGEGHILIAMKYIVNGVLQKHMVFFLFYQNLVGQMVGNKALMGIA